LLFTNLLSGQIFRFRNLGNENGIPNTFIYTLGQDKNGYLWVGTAAGISKFDGFTFYNVPYPDSTAGHYPTAHLKDRNGTLWFGCNDGSVYFYEDDILKKMPVQTTRFIEEIIEGPDGNVWFIPQGGSLFRTQSQTHENIDRFAIDSSLVIFSADITRTGDIILGTQENIKTYSVEENKLSLKGTIEGFDYYNVTAIHRYGNSDIFVVGTNGNSLFKLDIREGMSVLTRLSDLPELESVNVNSISEDSEGNLWISTNDSGFLRIGLSDDGTSVKSIRRFDRNSGLPGNNGQLFFQDLEGNLWFGLFGDGLSMLSSLAFSFYAPGDEPGSNDIIYVNKASSGFFIGTREGFFIFDPENYKAGSLTDLRGETDGGEITAYCIEDDGRIWIGTGGKGLFIRDLHGRSKRFFLSGDSGKDYIKDITTDGKYVWLGTLNGVIVLDKRNGTLISEYDITRGLPHNSIAQVFRTTEGKVAVATKTDRLYFIDPVSGVTSGNAIMPGTMNSISSFSQDSEGHIWAGTEGYGLYELFDDSLYVFTRTEQLMSDYCYSVLADSRNRIWAGHERGFSVYDISSGVMKTYDTDFAQGGKCNPNGMYESDNGIVFIGTTQGLIIYDSSKDIQTPVAPINNINYITINDIQYPYKPSFTLPYRKKYTITVNYVGINLREPDKVYYQTKLDNWDTDWSKWTTDREVTLSPRDGRYKFSMVSAGEDEIMTDPVTFSLIIKKPFWRTIWFYLASIILITGTVVLIVREREKAQKKLELYLKKELEARTSEVMKQKDRIEQQNVEITDSINYAKRIQSSILPDFNKLKDVCRDAFIIFYPRDIVSGDFYWFDKSPDGKFILVCADSTGHGVPGAFMSMIGSTLLQDIVSRQHITRPSQILKMLDNQIFTTLNQNLELGVSNDGMDMIVCEINIKTRHIRFASAMRPVMIVLKGETLYIKGNRSSIGGESVIEKFFDDQEYHLEEGDTIYLFSDGLPDQFGGPDGKKMKIARLKKLIEDVNQLPMEEQRQQIVRFYEEWKGEYDQVDDILLIGARF
jgi:serine phosphatase RsbU (regulator of sigma subunit)/ligand-binding sensor domain-containing protein